MASVVSRGLVGLNVCLLCLVVVACAGDRADRNGTTADQFVLSQVEELSENVEAATNSFLKGLSEHTEQSDCPRVDHIAKTATDATRKLADRVDQLSDATIAALLVSGTPPGGVPLDATDELTDSLRDESLELSADLIENALEEDCERRQQLLAASIDRFRRKRNALLKTFDDRIGSSPSSPPSPASTAPSRPVPFPTTPPSQVPLPRTPPPARSPGWTGPAPTAPPPTPVPLPD